nr:hypothetical protein [Lentibacillus sp. JNUCC-1]
MGVILEVSGYVSNQAIQPDAAVSGIRMMISGIPMLILVIVFICFYIYPIRRSPQQQSDNFDQVAGDR